MRVAERPLSDSALRHEPRRIAVSLQSRGLGFRIFSLAILFASELVVISTFLDGSSLSGAHGLSGAIHDWGPSTLRAIVGVAALLGTFLWLKHRPALERISSELEELPIGWGWLGLHALAMAAFVWLSSELYGSNTSTIGLSPDLGAALWMLAGGLGIVFGSLTAVPWKQWLNLFAAGGRLWIYASAAIMLASEAGNFSRSLWQPASYVTFTLVRLLLKPFVAGFFANPARLQLGTARFHVIVAPECSGLEGAGLILAFGLVWLVLFRRECRFPQSLALVPAGVAALFLLNAVRIAALVLIGDAGARQIALGGFHSQAGWILFNAVAVAFCVTIRNVSWFTVRAPGGFAAEQFGALSLGVATTVIYPAVTTTEHVIPSASRGTCFAQNVNGPASTIDNPTAAYLVPFLAILAAGMIATAASGGFEWLYPLRMVAAGAALWFFRKRYVGLTWRISWIGVASGVGVFLAWIAIDRLWNGASSGVGEPSALLAASPLVRTAWIALRAAAAITTVPLAEELAFRGFLMRRFISADFETVSWQRVTWFALIASSVVFGLLHGGLWIAGIFAGLVFGLVLKRKGGMGDAVAAHAVANAMLAAYVLYYGKWQLW